MATSLAPPEPPDPQAGLLAAFQRAVAEKLTCGPTEIAGVWTCSGYTIVETGPRPLDVVCCCPDARFRGRLCKHAVSMIAARRRIARPLATPAPAPSLRPPAIERWCLQCGLNPVVDCLPHCRDCDARPAAHRRRGR